VNTEKLLNEALRAGVNPHGDSRDRGYQDDIPDMYDYHNRPVREIN
jgi:hypothetical protein